MTRLSKRVGAAVRTEDREGGEQFTFACFSPASDTSIAALFGVSTATVRRARRRLFNDPPDCAMPIVRLVAPFINV
jgi:hypothetical protein